MNQEAEELLIFHSKDHQITADGSKAVFWKMLYTISLQRLVIPGEY
jgi:hypothetical protein